VLCQFREGRNPLSGELFFSTPEPASLPPVREAERGPRRSPEPSESGLRLTSSAAGAGEDYAGS